MNTIKNNISVFTNGNAKKRPLLFVHGFPFDHYMWDNQVNKFSDEYFCVTYDIRGLGASAPGDGQFTIEMFTDDLFNIVEEMNLHKPVLCGLSMGGYISLRAVERNENLFGGLILCDTKSAADDNTARLKRAAGIKKINEEGVKSFVRDFIPNCFAEDSIKKLGKVYDDLIERSSNFTAEGIKGCLLAMAGRTDTTEYLSKIKIPVLVLCGEKDKLTPPPVMKEIADLIPGSEFYIIPGAGHVTPLENPEELNKLIQKFLTKIF
jgi:pimeloyl-ACP methyl ester carboxylesterase